MLTRYITKPCGVASGQITTANMNTYNCSHYHTSKKVWRAISQLLADHDFEGVGELLQEVQHRVDHRPAPQEVRKPWRVEGGG